MSMTPNPLMTEGEALAEALRDGVSAMEGLFASGDYPLSDEVVEIGLAAIADMRAALTAAQQPVQEVPTWVDPLAEKWACCLAADHGAGPVLKQCADEMLAAAYGRSGPPYSFVYGIGRKQPAPPSAPVGVEVVPPEAKKVEGPALGAGFVHKDDWAIPSGSCSVRIVDQRMAYGWNQCREEMLERIAQQPAQAAPGDSHD